MRELRIDFEVEKKIEDGLLSGRGCVAAAAHQPLRTCNGAPYNGRQLCRQHAWVGDSALTDWHCSFAPMCTVDIALRNEMVAVEVDGTAHWTQVGCGRRALL